MAELNPKLLIFAAWLLLVLLWLGSNLVRVVHAYDAIAYRVGVTECL